MAAVADDDYSDFEDSDWEAQAEQDRARSDAEERACLDAEDGQVSEPCPICLEVPESMDLARLDCGHRGCRPCFGGWIRSCIRSRRTRPEDLSCPSCRAELSEPTVEFLLDGESNGKELYAELQDARARECALAGSPRSRAVQCPTPDCGIVLVPRSMEEGTCPQCQRSFCAICGHPSHRPRTCDGQLAAAAASAFAPGIFSRCPSCGHGCERIEGCNFMTCRCRAHFCHLCNSALTEAEHHSHFNGFHGADGVFGAFCRNRPLVTRGASAPNRPWMARGPVEVQTVERLLAEGAPLQNVLERFAGARFAGNHLALQDVAERMLVRGIQEGNLAVLRQATAECRQVGVDVTEAQAVLDAEEQRAVTSQLQRAMQRRDRTALRASIAAARAAAVDTAMILEAQAVLQDERVRHARQALEAACRRRNLATLYTALEEARSAGMLPTELRVAEDRVTELRDALLGKKAAQRGRLQR